MVVTDPDDVERLVAAGVDVVLVVPEGTAAVTVGSGGPGRLAILVGEAGEPATLGAAEEMDRELFGPR